MTDYSNKPTGGRGKTAQHPTMTVRIPIAIKNDVENLSQRCRDGIRTAQIADIIEIVQRYQDNKKDTRDWTIANRLIDELTNIIPE
jgi:hypothetical protein